MTQIELPKLGLMIHYGVYSLLAGEWRGKTVPWLAEWIQHTAGIPSEVYRRYAKELTARNFAADALAAFCRDRGFESVCLTAKHHDGYCLFDTHVDDFQSPRDLVGELAAACREHDLKFSVYYSQAQDWADPRAFKAYDTTSGRDFAAYFTQKCLPQITELLTRYGPIYSIWFDTPDRMREEDVAYLRQHVKKLQPNCLISGRIGHGFGDYAVCQDNLLPAVPWELPWEVPISLYDSWGYKKGRPGARSKAEALRLFLKTLARGGHALFNLGPQGDGSAPAEDLAVLAHVGDYAREHAIAVYDTEPAPLPLYDLGHWYLTHRSAERRLFVHIPDGAALSGTRQNLIGYDGTLIGARLVEDGGLGRPLEYLDRRTLEGEPCWTFTLPSLDGPACVALDYATADPKLRTYAIHIHEGK